MTEKRTWRGIFTIPSTPFTENGEVDVPSFERVVDFCIDCGAHGLVFPVNASEFSVLSDQERTLLSKVLVERNAGRLPVIVGVAGVAKEVAVNFASHARAIGADGVIAMPPYVQQTAHRETIRSYYEAISRASQMPVFIQNYGGPIGTPLDADFILEMCRTIEHVQYVKEETVPSTVNLTAMVEGNRGECLGFFGGAGGRYLIEEFRRGVDGNMPGCHVTDVLVALWNALEAKDERRALHIYKELSPLFFFEHQLPGCYKEVLFRRGIITCPLKRNGAMPLDPIASRYLDEILDSLEPLMSSKVGR